MGNTDWHEVLCGDMNSSLDAFMDVLKASFLKHCPLKKMKIYPKQFIKEKWMTRELLRKSQEIQNLYKTVCREKRDSENYLNFIHIRNNFNKEKC